MPEGHVFSGLQNRVGPLSIAPAGTKDYSVCSVRAMISSWVSGDRAVKNAEYPATRTTKSRYWSGCFFASSSVSRDTMLYWICQPLCTSKKVRSSTISFCLSDSFSRVDGFSF